MAFISTDSDQYGYHNDGNNDDDTDNNSYYGDDNNDYEDNTNGIDVKPMYPDYIDDKPIYPSDFDENQFENCRCVCGYRNQTKHHH